MVDKVNPAVSSIQFLILVSDKSPPIPDNPSIWQSSISNAPANMPVNSAYLNCDLFVLHPATKVINVWLGFLPVNIKLSI